MSSRADGGRYLLGQQVLFSTSASCSQRSHEKRKAQVENLCIQSQPPGYTGEWPGHSCGHTMGRKVSHRLPTDMRKHDVQDPRTDTRATRHRHAVGGLRLTGAGAPCGLGDAQVGRPAARGRQLQRRGPYTVGSRTGKRWANGHRKRTWVPVPEVCPSPLL